ncbi:translocon-associated protein subunit alpha [Neocloeon triangulifer]|uniref:translocon-associated protein subunit alpha n=1 Tax=Neocloeon triangulifer TaxID=2078957 RepID=UPI00286F3A49|nr:translocon-associated protein subunit alpha [Neocloeon triangulifer]
MKLHLWLGVLVLPAILLLASNNVLVRAEDDIDDEGVDVEGEDLEVETSVTGDEEAAEPTGPGASPDAETTILFTSPVGSSNLELAGGKLVEFLVGFSNKGKQEFVLETLDASFRYPMDFTFYIQNFSTLAYSRLVKPGHEATLAYSFIPSEAFAGRPFGLSINLNYRDASGGFFREAVYNETVQVVELDEGLDGEVFFMYVFLAACVVLLLVGGQQVLVSVGKKRGHISRKPQLETGTNDNPNDVNYEWLPKDALKNLNNQQRSPKQSPRQRKAKRSDD